VNDDNLIPLSERSEGEARESGGKGGKKSGEVRRRKRNVRQLLTQILAAKPDIDGLTRDMLAACLLCGVKPDNNDELLAATLFMRALSDTASLKYLDELMGRNPTLELKREELALRREEVTFKKRLTEKVEMVIEDPYEGLTELELRRLASGEIVECNGKDYRLQRSSDPKAQAYAEDYWENGAIRNIWDDGQL